MGFTQPLRQISKDKAIVKLKAENELHLFLGPPARSAEVLVAEDDLCGRPAVAEEVLLAGGVAAVAGGAPGVAQRGRQREGSLQRRKEFVVTRAI